MSLITILLGSGLAAAIIALWRISSRLRARSTDAQWLEGLFDSNAAALAVITDAGRVTRANEAFYGVVGAGDAWKASLSRGTTVETNVIRAGGSAGRISIAAVAVEGRPRELLLIATDITAHWAAQQALESARVILEARTNELSGVMSRETAAVEELQRSELSRGRAETILEEQQHAVTSLAARLATANRELEAFSYSVSHDLRTPLRSIDGFTKVLLDHYGPLLDARAHDYLTRVRKATKRMSLLIDDLLKLARISKSTIRWQRVDLEAEAHAIIERLHESNPDRRIIFRAEGDLVVDGDANLLRIVLDNLLGNAWKFTARCATAVIVLGRREEDGAVYVRDNGAGFDMRYADALFGPFQRLHTSAEFEGTGVGLATVERIISMHGGRVSADAAVGEGATFHFTVRGPRRSNDNHHQNGEKAA